MAWNKKGQAATVLSGLLAAVVVFAIVAVTNSLTGDVVSDIRDTQTVNTAAYNISSDGLTGLLNFGDQLGNIGQILAVSAIIAILFGAFAFVRLSQ